MNLDNSTMYQNDPIQTEAPTIFYLTNAIQKIIFNIINEAILLCKYAICIKWIQSRKGFYQRRNVADADFVLGILSLPL